MIFPSSILKIIGQYPYEEIFKIDFNPVRKILNYDNVNNTWKMTTSGNSQQNIEKDRFISIISSQKYKVVKFASQKVKMMAVKIISLDNNQSVIALFLKRIYQVKQYLLRLHQLTWEGELLPYLDTKIKDSQSSYVIKIMSPFYQHPQLVDFYQFPNYRDDHKSLKNKQALVYYFQEFFMHIFRGEGITNFIYSPHNFYISPPDQKSGLTMGRLFLNFTSTAGLKFIQKSSQITKKEFEEIYPCLPPNTEWYLKENKYKELNVEIKIRSFAFNIFCFVLKRVPSLLMDINEIIFSSSDEKGFRLLEESPETFKLLINLERKELDRASKSTGVNLKKLFTKVFVDCNITLQEVYQMVFMENYINKEDAQKSHSGKSTRQIIVQRKQYFDKLIELIWSQQTPQKKKRYVDLGYVEQKPSMLYLLVKTNCNFHKFLKYSNLLDFFQRENFTIDGSQMVCSLLKFLKGKQNKQKLSIKATSDEVQPKPIIYGKEFQRKNFDLAEFSTPTEEQKRQNPWQMESKSATSADTFSFFQNILSLRRLQAEEDQNTKKERVISTMQRKMEILNEYKHNMW